jgi:hypothetical protein
VKNGSVCVLAGGGEGNGCALTSTLTLPSSIRFQISFPRGEEMRGREKDVCLGGRG